MDFWRWLAASLCARAAGARGRAAAGRPMRPFVVCGRRLASRGGGQGGAKEMSIGRCCQRRASQCALQVRALVCALVCGQHSARPPSVCVRQTRACCALTAPTHCGRPMHAPSAASAPTHCARRLRKRGGSLDTLMRQHGGASQFAAASPLLSTRRRRRRSLPAARAAPREARSRARDKQRPGRPLGHLAPPACRCARAAPAPVSGSPSAS